MPEDNTQIIDQGTAATKEKIRKTGREIRSFLAIFILTFLLLHVVISFHSVPSSSMEPTIPTKSMIVVFRLPYILSDPVPKRGEVVVFYDVEEEISVVKRVIGLPGDTIKFKDGYVFLNEEMLEEPYLLEQGSSFSEETEFVVPANCFFAMGDNRENSFDSRFKDSHYPSFSMIQGKCILVFSIGHAEKPATKGVKA